MKPIDLRNETWESLQTRIQGRRLCVWAAWQAHGPGTTRELADRSGLGLLQLCPRTTELYQIGFLECTGRVGTMGVYRAKTANEIRAFLEAERAASAPRTVQPELALA